MNIMIEPLGKSTRSRLLAVVVIMLLISGCDSLLYVPDRGAPHNSCFDELGMRHVPLVASDRTSIYAWYAKAREPQLPTLAYFTGNAGNVAHRACLVRPYVERGYGVLILSYRGYGGSGGRPDEPGLYLDAEAALDYLADQAGVPTERTVLYGQSLGSAVAVEMAVRRPAAALILLAPFTSAPAAARSIAWFVPLPFGALFSDRFDSIGKIERVDEPLLVIHGTADGTIPAQHGQALFDAALVERKELVLIPGADHNDLHGMWRRVSGGDPIQICASLETLDESCAHTWVIGFLEKLGGLGKN
jgi:fermentation-respiration switch protein FrsA (DUF1100 family)